MDGVPVNRRALDRPSRELAALQNGQPLRSRDPLLENSRVAGLSFPRRIDIGRDSRLDALVRMVLDWGERTAPRYRGPIELVFKEPEDYPSEEPRNLASREGEYDREREKRP